MPEIHVVPNNADPEARRTVYLAVANETRSRAEARNAPPSKLPHAHLHKDLNSVRKLLANCNLSEVARAVGVSYLTLTKYAHGIPAGGGSIYVWDAIIRYVTDGHALRVVTNKTATVSAVERARAQKREKTK